ncbi:UNVERIFIED_CONTAM: hypothetical protein FKN15_019447 [Acipenser sinensis]
MDQWLWYNPEPSRNRWDGGLEDFFGGLEEEGWCLACGEFGHLVACCPFQEEEDLLPAQKRKRRRGGRSRRRTKEPGPSPVWKMEVVPTIAQKDDASADGKIMFRKPVKRSSDNKFQRITATSSKKKKGNEKKDSEGSKTATENLQKKVKNSSLLSFGDDEEED